MNPQEQRIADELIERIRQRRDTIDPELAQRIHQGLRDAPDAFYLLAQAAVARGIQFETLQAQQSSPQTGWQGQPPSPPPQQQPGLLASIFGPTQPAAPSQNYYGQPPAYGTPQGGGLPPSQPVQGQPLGSAGYQAVNSNLPGANVAQSTQFAQGGYAQPYGGQNPYPASGYAANPYPGQPPYPQQGYVSAGGYPPQAGYGQPVPVQPPYPPVAGYPPSQSGYPSGAGWAQPGGGMLGGMGGVVAGVAAGALVTGAVESVVHGYENHERREEWAREERGDRNDSWRSDHERGLVDTDSDGGDGSFYNSAHDASRSNDSDRSNFADTDDTAGDAAGDAGDDSDTNDTADASDMGGFGNDSDNS